MSNIIRFPGTRRPTSGRADIRMCRESVPRAYARHPRNGEVWVTESYEIQYVGCVEVDILGDFIVLHMADDDGDSASCYGSFETLEKAQAAAARIARECNAVLS